MKYCTNCQEYKESWADHPDYHSLDTYQRHDRCWACDKYTLNGNFEYSRCTTVTSCGSNSGYSYTYRGSNPSHCQAEDCSLYASDGESYCQVCKNVQFLCRQIENKTSLGQVKDAAEFITW